MPIVNVHKRLLTHTKISKVCGVFILPSEPWNAQIASFKDYCLSCDWFNIYNHPRKYSQKSLKSAKIKSANIFGTFLPIKNEY